MSNIKNYQQTISTLSEEILGTWDAAEDHGESGLTGALYEAEQLGYGDLARTIMEGTVEMVFEQLLHNEESYSMLATIADYRYHSSDRIYPEPTAPSPLSKAEARAKFRLGRHLRSKDLPMPSDTPLMILGWRFEDTVQKEAKRALDVL